MSRSMTAAQVIAAGDYLKVDFEPSSLTVSQLLGIFGYHNVRYPTPYTKPKLVQLFNDEIKSKAKSYQKERVKAESSIASDDGILNGVTGEYLNPSQPLRRSSRRSSRAPTSEPEHSEPEAPKRRRVSRQPSGGRGKRAAAAAEPVVVEESEPEEEQPPKKVNRGKNSEDVGSRSRKVSTSSAFAEDSGWEDNNMFQSGAESSSPARAKPRSRKSAPKPAAGPTRRTTRKVSAPPPERLPSSSPPASDDEEEDEPTQKPVSQRRTAVSPVRAPPSPSPVRASRSPVHASPLHASTFEPELPSPVIRQSNPFGNVGRTPLKTAATPGKTARTPFTAKESPFSSHEPPLPPASPFVKRTPARVAHEVIPDSDPEEDELSLQQEGAPDSVESYEEDEDATQVRRVGEALGRTSSSSGLVEYTPPPEPRASIFPRLMILLTLALTAAVGYPWKQQSIAIGFCDPGSSTNDALESLRTHTHAVELCQAENRTTLYSVSDGVSTDGMEACPTSLETIVPQPDVCTPCPADAVCKDREITCTNNLVVRPHPALSFVHFPLTSTVNMSSLPLTFPQSTRAVYEAASFIFDGMPRFGPIAFPPHCAVDPFRERRIEGVASGIQTALKKHRGMVTCSGASAPFSDAEGGEARQFGKERKQLYDEAHPEKLNEEALKAFDHIFDVAMQELEQAGVLVTGLDKEGHVYYAHKTADMDIACAIKVKSREAWKEWQISVLTTAGMALTIMYMRYSRAATNAEKARAKELIPIALDMLRNQEISHYVDPVQAEPRIPSLQLRDTLLADEHSVSRRTRIWEHVARVVEGNANVRVNEDETAAGDEARMWTWVGEGGRTIAYEGQGGRVVA